VIEPLYLVDTNICISILADAESAAARRLGACAPGVAVASAITYAELMLGLARASAEEMGKARRFFDQVPVMPFDVEAAAAYASLPFRRASYDRLLAAHALALDLTLVTSNVRDFQDVPQLRIDNWAAK
jgi:tRNA(fMet)-specific endonuclease VapC